MISEAIPADVTIAAAKSQPVEKVEEVEKEVTPLEAISHGDVLPGKSSVHYYQMADDV